MHRHRATCQAPGCGRSWRENCAECATDAAERHRAETGHPVELRITQADNWHEVQEMAGMAHRVLMLRGMRRGW